MTSEKIQLRFLSIDDLEFLPENPRSEIYDDSLRDLSKSLLRDGLIEPIVVRPHGNKFEVALMVYEKMFYFHSYSIFCVHPIYELFCV